MYSGWFWCSLFINSFFHFSWTATLTHHHCQKISAWQRGEQVSSPWAKHQSIMTLPVIVSQKSHHLQLPLPWHCHQNLHLMKNLTKAWVILSHPHRKALRTDQKFLLSVFQIKTGQKSFPLNLLYQRNVEKSQIPTRGRVIFLTQIGPRWLKLWQPVCGFILILLPLHVVNGWQNKYFKVSSTSMQIHAACLPRSRQD